MATARPVRAMDLYAEQFWAPTRRNGGRGGACGSLRGRAKRAAAPPVQFQDPARFTA